MEVFVIKSMTGYGAYEHVDDQCKVSIELKSVNNRYLDIFLNIGRDFDYTENQIKAKLAEQIKRGKLSCKINIDLDREVAINIDTKKAESYFKALSNLKDHLNLTEPISLSTILTAEDIVSEEACSLDKDYYEKLILESLDMAIDSFVESRVNEGKRLYEDLVSRLDSFNQALSNIESIAGRVVDDYREKLRKRIHEIVDLEYDYLEYKIASEIVLFAEKSDITEEIIRLKSHLDLFEESLNLDEPVGKKLDFICQEMLRETNTIGSKSSDKDIVQEVINMKTLIDQIREQVQNIE